MRAASPTAGLTAPGSGPEPHPGEAGRLAEAVLPARNPPLDEVRLIVTFRWLHHRLGLADLRWAATPPRGGSGNGSGFQQVLLAGSFVLVFVRHSRFFLGLKATDALGFEFLANGLQRLLGGLAG